MKFKEERDNRDLTLSSFLKEFTVDGVLIIVPEDGSCIDITGASDPKAEPYLTHHVAMVKSKITKDKIKEKRKGWILTPVVLIFLISDETVKDINRQQEEKENKERKKIGDC